TCNQNGISIDDQHLVDLYTSIQLMLPSLSDIDEEDRPELLRAMRIEFKIMHELADHQMAAHAQQDPLGSALVNLHERNNNYLELYIGDARPEALRQKAPQLDRELNRLEARIKSLPDSSRKQLYNFFHTSIRDRFAEKLVPFITIPKLIFSTITHNVDRTKSTNETAATREELQNGIIQAQKRMEEIKQALLTFRTTPDETMHLQGLMINMRIQHQFLTTKLSLSPNTSYNPSPTDTLPPSPFQAIIGNTEEEIMELLSLPEE
ncbi:MAG: hypothetical protein P0S94_00400, partial [Simkaniaceae bacterium]|nr:hypothetical protein [Simkaniaceae bacterium]